MQALVTFDDVAVCFSEEEWKGLQDKQKDLYCQVMTDNYRNLTALGLSETPPEIVLKIERGEAPCMDDQAAVLLSPGGPAVAVGGQSRWAQWKRGGPRAGGRAVSRRSLRLVKKGSNPGEEETSAKKTDFRGKVSDRSPRGEGGPGGGKRSKDPRESHLGDPELSDRKAHTCARCGESWGHLVDLLTHQMGGCQDRPHRCSVCGKTFVKRQHLTAHRKTHTEERPYTCQQCGRSFRQNSTLTTHLWSHAGHKPFHCTCCPKTFSRKTDLVAHVRRHTGERPYQCPYCWDRFIRKKSLQRHLQRHSGEDLRTGWERSFPGWRGTDGCVERDPKMEEIGAPDPEPAIEFSFRWDTEQKADVQSEGRPLLAAQEHPSAEEKPRPPVPTYSDQATQTQDARPGRVHQRVLRELRRCRRGAARAQHERDLMRAAMDHLVLEMKELKEMVGALRPAPPTPSWVRPPEDSGRASPESSLQCPYESALDAPCDRGRHPPPWAFGDEEEDDMLPTTTIKREEGPELSPSPEFPFRRLPSSLQTGERLASIAMNPLGAEKEWTLLARSAGKPGRFAALVFRALVPFDVYKSWVNRVNLDGLRGRKGVPLNVKQRVMAIVERHFNLRRCDQSEVRNRLNEQLRTRRKSDKPPPSDSHEGAPY